MAVRVFPLRYVSQEEADAVREALTKARIEFYETPPSTPGVGDSFLGSDTEAIWVTSDADAPPTLKIIERVQAELHRGPSPEPTVTLPIGWKSTTMRLVLLVVLAIVVLVLAVRYAVGASP